MKKYLKLMRIQHYIKNLLVFVPLFFHGSLFKNDKIWSALGGWIVFSLLASVIYIVNDIRDVNKDRMHPTKKNRPIASGDISVQKAVLLSGILILGVVEISNLIHASLVAMGYLAIYLVLNLLYSFGLKNYPIIDITILASGFLIRILYGAALTQIKVSNWLYLTVVTMAFYLVLGKRRNELVQQDGQGTRTVLLRYSLQFLDKHMYLCLAITIMFYAMWTMEKNNPVLVWTVPVVLLICMKYNLDVEGDSDGDPVEVLLRDKILMVMCMIYGGLMLGALYL